MATLSDLKEVKEALDAGLVSQAEYDEVKCEYLRAKKEFQKKALRAKEEALEASKECQKKELEFQKRELIAKEKVQQKKSEADLRAYALESIVKHGSSLMSEEQKADLVRDYAKMSGLDGGATVNDARASKRQRVSAEDRDAAQPQPSKPPRTSPAAAVPPPADAPAPAAANEAPAPTPAPALRRTLPPPAPGTSTNGVVIDKQIFRLLSMSEEQNDGLVRGYGKMPGLDRSDPALKRQRPLAERRDVSPPPPQPRTSTPPAAVPSPADAPAPVDEDEDEYSNYSDGDGEDASDYDEPRTAKRTKSKNWTDKDDAALVAALRAGQKAYTIRIPGRRKKAATNRLHTARVKGLGSPALREYLEETCPEYVYKPPSKNLSWSAEEDQTFIQAHREGKLLEEIAAMLPRRTYSAVYSRWREAKKGQLGTAALLAYAAAYCKLKRPISREDRASLLF